MMKKGLQFSPAAHRYRLDGQPVPGVTTILGVLNKPALPKWAAKTVAEYVADNADGVEQLRAMGRESMVAALKETPWGKRDAAATRGTTIHDHAERILRGEDVEIDDDDPVLPVIEQAIRFMDDWQIEPVLIEAPVASRAHWYAGTLDLGARYVHPVTGHAGVGIFDWKSGKAIYPEAAMQLAAYAGADFAGLGEDATALPTFDASFGVHLRADGYDVHPLQFGPDVFDEFVAIRAVFEIKKRMDGNWRVPGSGYVGVAVREAVTA